MPVTVGKRAEGKSTRTIAEESGVSDRTVRQDEKRSGGNPLPPERSERVSGKDGKSYPSTPSPPEEIEARGEDIAEMKKEGKTVRQIAKKMKVSTGTVLRDIECSTVPGGAAERSS